jgi:hypothetical protein
VQASQLSGQAAETSDPTGRTGYVALKSVLHPRATKSEHEEPQAATWPIGSSTQAEGAADGSRVGASETGAADGRVVGFVVGFDVGDGDPGDPGQVLLHVC